MIPLYNFIKGEKGQGICLRYIIYMYFDWLVDLIWNLSCAFDIHICYEMINMHIWHAHLTSYLTCHLTCTFDKQVNWVNSVLFSTDGTPLIWKCNIYLASIFEITINMHLHICYVLLSCLFDLNILPAYFTCIFYMHFWPALLTCIFDMHIWHAYLTCIFDMHI